jgi:hypothetical protein
MTIQTSEVLNLAGRVTAYAVIFCALATATFAATLEIAQHAIVLLVVAKG